MNCWAVARSDRVATLVDGEEYFHAVREAIEAAERTVIILAWDFDSRAGLGFGPDGNPTLTVGELLNRWVRRGIHRRAYVLIWDYPMAYGFDREFPPIYGLGWKPDRRVALCYDNLVPMGASHHQKVVVVDDRVAFCGGLDLTGRRWDTCAHRAVERRRSANGKAYPPFHDAMMAVSGAAARALGDLARERWRAATGAAIEAASPPPPERPRRWRPFRRAGRAAPSDPWPKSLRPSFLDTDVAIARTMPASGSAEPVREGEALYFDLIRSARRTIYLENQYFTAHRLGEALADRLREPDGPEVVVVTRLLSHGWLETMTMERLRSALILRLQEADRHGRFQVFYSHVGGLPEGQCLDVHSKLMVVDDEILRIGSANFANRSMGFDTECDLALEAGADPGKSAEIAGFRTRLLAEHLGVEPSAVTEAVGRHGSLIAAIRSLARPLDQVETNHRTLGVLTVEADAAVEPDSVLGLADPEHAIPLDGLIREFDPSGGAGRRGGWAGPAVLGVILVLLFALWRWTPLAALASGDAVVAAARRAAGSAWTAPALVAGYVLATFVMFPRPLLTLFAVLAFGPWAGFGLTMVGILAATALHYLIGRKLPRAAVRRFAGPSLNRIMEVIRHRGLIAMTILRLVPVAPFAVPGIVAGAVHVSFLDVMLGTFLGNAPGVLVTTILGDWLTAVLHHPTPVDYGLFALGAVAALTAALLARRALVRVHLPTPRA